MKGRDVIVSGTVVRVICKGINMEQALAEALQAADITIMPNERNILFEDIGRAVEKKEWRDKQLTLI